MTTTNYGWTLPVVGGNEDSWGTTLNTLWTDLDTLLGGVSQAEFALLSGLTATAAELNVLDGITATVTELNYTDGVTSNIQTQLDGKQALDATLTALAGLTTAANKVIYATASDTFGTLDFVDEDNMASNSATALPSQQSVKAYVDAGDALQLGVGQTWQDMTASRTYSTSYQNTTGKPIMVSVQMSGSSNSPLQVSSNGSTWIDVSTGPGSAAGTAITIVPNNHYYRLNGAETIGTWAELR